MANEYKRIGVYSNWCGLAAFNNDQNDLIKNGDRIEILWPDGTKSRHKVKLKEWTATESDMGHPCSVPYSTAYVKQILNGLAFDFQISGLSPALKGKRV